MGEAACKMEHDTKSQAWYQESSMSIIRLYVVCMKLLNWIDDPHAYTYDVSVCHISDIAYWRDYPCSINYMTDWGL